MNISDVQVTVWIWRILKLSSMNSKRMCRQLTLHPWNWRISWNVTISVLFSRCIFCTNSYSFTGYYPEFHPQFKDGKLCPDDYVYGYSLLMYFSCVTYPESKMQDICKKMQVETQLIIKTFLQNLLDCKSFSRESIKAVIELSGMI